MSNLLTVSANGITLSRDLPLSYAFPRAPLDSHINMEGTICLGWASQYK